MMQQLKKAAPKLRLTLGCSTFVPKAHTPFQWYGVSSGEPRQHGLGQRVGWGGPAGGVGWGRVGWGGGGGGGAGRAARLGWL